MKITMYELLGMVKDGKAPNKIKYINSIWEYDEETKDYFHDNLWLIYSMNSIGLTEREVEIIEEENKKCTVETCCIGIERLSKALLKIKDDMKSIYENIDKVETLEEEKKIPKKICTNRIINTNDILEFEMIQNKINAEYTYAINSIIDYLKSKGE